MINNSILRADAQVCNNLDVRVKHEYDRKRKMHEHDNTIEQSGRSMIEMLGVLAIVGVLSVGGIAGYSKAMTKFKINKTIDQVSHIVTNIRTLYAQQTSYAGLSTPNAIAMGVMPDGISTSILKNYGGSYNSDYYDNANPFNGGIIVYSNNGMGGFVISYTGLPKEACITLATYDWGSNYSSGLLAITASNISFLSGPMHSHPSSECDSIGGTYYAIACPGDADNPAPMSVTKAAQACNCEDNSCSIGWKFQ